MHEADFPVLKIGNLNQITTLANVGRLSVLRGDDLVSEYTRLCDTLDRWFWRRTDGNLHRDPKQKAGAKHNAERTQLCGTGSKAAPPGALKKLATGQKFGGDHYQGQMM